MVATGDVWSVILRYDAGIKYLVGSCILVRERRVSLSDFNVS